MKIRAKIQSSKTEILKIYKIGSNEKKLVKNTFWLYIMQVSSYIFPLLTFPYLTRILGADKYGVVVFCNATIQYFQLFLEFGFILSATNLVAVNRDDVKKIGNILVGVIQGKLILCVIGAVCVAGLCLFVQRFADIALYFILSYISILITIFLPDFLFRGLEKMKVITVRVLLSKFVYTALIFILVHKVDDYIRIPIALALSNLCAVGFTWGEINKMKIKPQRCGIKDTMHYLKESSSFFLSRIASTAYTSLNTVLLGIKFPSAVLAQYGAANSLKGNLNALMSPIADSIFPYMVKNKNFKLVKKIILILEPLVILCCVAIWIFARPIILLLCGIEYEESVKFFRLMLPMVAMTLLSYLFGFPVLGALGKVKWANISVIIASCFHLVGLSVLFMLGKMRFLEVIVLTIFTEFIVLGIRFFIVFKEFFKLKRWKIGN